MMKKTMAALMMSGGVLLSYHASAVPTFTTPDFALPSFSGNGLIGSVWTEVTIPLSPQPPLFSFPDRNIAWAKSYMASHTPQAVFVSTRLDYPSGQVTTISDNQTIGAFLGSDASSLSSTTVASTRILTQGESSDQAIGTIMRFTGYYRVDTPSIVSFNIASDDGADIVIQGQQIAVNQPADPVNGTPAGGIHEFAALNTGPAQVEFTSPGLYALTINYYDGQHTLAGLEFGTGAPLSSAGNLNIIPQSLLYQSPIPVPATGALFASCLLALVGFRARRTQQS